MNQTNKDSIVTSLVVPGTIAASSAILISRLPFSGEALAGFGIVSILAAIAVLEYRPSRRS